MIPMKNVTHATLIAVAYGAVCLFSSMQGGQPVLPASDPDVKLREQKDDPRKVESPDRIEEKMFPEGMAHVFDKVQRGTQVYHAFRIVNTSKVPVRIVSRRGA